MANIKLLLDCQRRSFPIDNLKIFARRKMSDTHLRFINVQMLDNVSARMLGHR